MSKAYILIPESKEELQKVLDLKWPLNDKQKTSANHTAQTEILKLYDGIVKKFGYKNPFAFQTHASNKNIKIMRLLELDKLRLPSLSNVKLEYGNGSRNGQGANNNGFKYEHQLGRALAAYAIAGEEGLRAFPSMISTVNQIVSLLPKNHVIMQVIPAGKANSKRKIPIDESGIHTITDRDADIGNIISDITIITEGKFNSTKETYISAKFGDTVAFLNLGLKQWFHKDEIESNSIKNSTAKSLLSILGINEQEFCAAFNNYDVHNKKRTTDTKAITHKIDKVKLLNIVKSTIGYGYIMVHKQKGGTIVKEISKTQMNKYLQFKGISVQYPVDGSVKLVKAKVKLSGLDIDFVIRATDGSVYPTHMVANYTYTNL